MHPHTSIARGAAALCATLSILGCQARAPHRPALESARADLAIVRPQADDRVAGFIDKLDGADVGRYVRGWGGRPKLREVGIDPGTHTLEVGYYDWKTRAFSRHTIAVTFAAEGGHLYHVRIAQRALLAKLGAVVGTDDLAWHAWIEDRGAVTDGTLIGRVQPPAAPTRRRHARRKATTARRSP